MSLMTEATVRVTNLEDVPFKQLRALLDTKTFARITGLFEPAEILTARERVRQRFDGKNDRKHDPKDAEAIRRNFQKLIVGGTRGSSWAGADPEGRIPLRPEERPS